MEISTDQDEDSLTINLEGKLDFHCARAFKESYIGHSDKEKYVINMEHVERMDSSGLGILLNMRNTLSEAEIEIVNVPEPIMRVLTISRFDSKFTIH